MSKKRITLPDLTLPDQKYFTQEEVKALLEEGLNIFYSKKFQDALFIVELIEKKGKHKCYFHSCRFTKLTSFEHYLNIFMIKIMDLINGTIMLIEGEEEFKEKCLKK